MLTDAQRIERIKYLVDNSFSDKIVVGHDIHTKHVLVSIQEVRKMSKLHSHCIVIIILVAGEVRGSWIRPFSGARGPQDD